MCIRDRRSHAVGLVTDAIATSPFAGRIIGGAMDTAAERGYVLLLFDSQDRREEEAEGMAELARRQVDGFLYATMSLVELATPPPTTLPLVLANCYVGGEPTGGVAGPAVIPGGLPGGRAGAGDPPPPRHPPRAPSGAPRLTGGLAHLGGGADPGRRAVTPP